MGFWVSQEGATVSFEITIIGDGTCRHHCQGRYHWLRILLSTRRKYVICTDTDAFVSSSLVGSGEFPEMNHATLCPNCARVVEVERDWFPLLNVKICYGIVIIGHYSAECRLCRVAGWESCSYSACSRVGETTPLFKKVPNQIAPSIKMETRK